MDLELAGKTFIVTGGTDGLGLATAQTLLAEGANVLVTGLSEGKLAVLQAVAGERVAFGVAARVGITAELVSVGGPSASRALETDDDTWRGAFESVFLGTVRLIRACRRRSGMTARS